MIEVFNGRTADEAWLRAARYFQEGRHVEPHQASRAGDTAEVLHATFSIRDPRQRWIPSRVPALNPAFALAEVVWILRGRDDAAFLTYWNSRLPEYAGPDPVYHGAYGRRLRHGPHGTAPLDQLRRAYDALRSNPATRQVVLQIWDAGRDLPHADGSPQSADVPCNLVSMLKVRDGRLHWSQVIRSNDMLLGVPHNLVQFTSVQEVMAGWLGLEVGTYSQWSDSLHVYRRDWDDVMAAASSNGAAPEAAAPNTDRLAQGYDASERSFRELERRMEAFIAEGLSPEAHLEATRWPEAPEALQNVLRVLAAEAARRRGWPAVAAEAMAACTNPALRQLWAQWAERVGLRALSEAEA